MLLVMFDVDGTLTESSALDSAIFLDAVCEVFGFRDISDDWSIYRDVTSAGVVREIVQTRLSRLPTDEEAIQMQACFNKLLRAQVAKTGVQLIPGAAEVLTRLARSPNEYAVALASGNWRETVRFMLAAAGLSMAEMPGAFSDDDFTREGICRASRQRAEERCGRPIPKVVYVGDGVWDVRTSRALGYGFVGIGRGLSPAKLRAAGAVEILPDFEDTEAFLAAVGRAVSTLPPVSSQYGETAASAR